MVYLGCDRRYDHLPHHNAVFGEGYRETFTTIFDKLAIPEEILRKPGPLDSAEQLVLRPDFLGVGSGLQQVADDAAVLTEHRRGQGRLPPVVDASVVGAALQQFQREPFQRSAGLVLGDAGLEEAGQGADARVAQEVDHGELAAELLLEPALHLDHQEDGRYDQIVAIKVRLPHR